MTNTIKDGGSAFPVTFIDGPSGMPCAIAGMTLRDYFAAKAMQGFCAGAFWAECDMSEAASEAYKAADAMIAASKVTP